MCILQGDPSHLVGSNEVTITCSLMLCSWWFDAYVCLFLFTQIKNQIKSLFCDHTNLLEEFWVFFKQLHPQLHWCSDEDDAVELENKAELENKLDSSVDSQEQGTETAFCAENSSHTPNGNKVVLWTRLEMLVYNSFVDHSLLNPYSRELVCFEV